MKSCGIILFGLITFQYVNAQTSTLSGSIEKQVIVSGSNSDTIKVSPHQTKLRIYSYSTRKWSEYIDTDSKGSFSVQNVEKGNYLIQVNDPVVKTNNMVFVEVSNNGANTINPILIDRISKSIGVKKGDLDASDPQRGKWGGKSQANERIVSAKIRPSKKTNFYEIDIEVVSTNSSNPLKDIVKFHLHPSFKNATVTIRPVNGKAILRLTAWGAFTIGVEADRGVTKLELDLSKIEDAPQRFKEL